MIAENASNLEKRPLPENFVIFVRDLRHQRSVEDLGAPKSQRTELVLKKIEDGSFGRWREAGVPCSFQLDPQGLCVDIGIKGTKQHARTHVPYRFFERTENAENGEQVACDPHQYAEVLKTQGLDEGDVVEFEMAALRALKRTNDPAYQELVRRQEDIIQEHIQLHSMYGREYDLPPRPHVRPVVCESIIRQFENVRSTLIDGHGHIPRETIGEFLIPTADRKDPVWNSWYLHDARYTSTDPSTKVMLLFDLAEKLNFGTERDPFTSISARTWEQIRDSHAYTKINRHVFEGRAAMLGNARNYEVAKIISTIFATFSVEELRKQGFRFARGKYRDGLEMLSVWGNGDYARILINRATFLERDSEEKERYEQLPTIELEQYEALDALVLMFQQFEHFAHYAKRISERSPEVEAKLRDTNDALLRIANSDLHEYHRSIALAAEKLLEPGDTWDTAALHHYTETIKTALAAYQAEFDEREAVDIIADKARRPLARTVIFDENFLKDMPESMRKGELRFDEAISTSNRTVKVVESGERGLHYAQEGRALRALGIKPRPTIVITGGAARLEPGTNDWDVTRHALEQVFDAAFQTNANIVIPGTQSGIAIIAVRMYNERLARLDEAQRVHVPRMFAIEPGRDLYYPGNPYRDTAPDSAPWAVAVDTIATPFHAGWGTYGSESDYYQHVQLRQTLIKRSAEGLPVVNIALNGGGWLIMENDEALKDGFPVVTIGDTGRFSAIARVLKATLSEWSGMPNAADRSAYIAGRIPQLLHASEREDFQEDSQKELYRRKLFEFAENLRKAPDLVVPLTSSDNTITGTLVEKLAA